jgi:hypothetical protein
MRVTYTFVVDGVPTVADGGVVLREAAGGPGVIRLDTGGEVVAAGTAMTSNGDGSYYYDFDAPAPGLSYEARVQATHAGEGTAQVFSSEYRFGEPMSASTGGALPATRSDLEEKLGRGTLEELADLNNSRNPATISNRIQRALEFARDEIEDVTDIPSPVPHIVKHVAVALAIGWLNGEPSDTDTSTFQQTVLSGIRWARKKLDRWATTGILPEDATPSYAPATKGIKVVT